MIWAIIYVCITNETGYELKFNTQHKQSVQIPDSEYEQYSYWHLPCLHIDRDTNMYWGPCWPTADLMKAYVPFSFHGLIWFSDWCDIHWRNTTLYIHFIRWTFAELIKGTLNYCHLLFLSIPFYYLKVFHTYPRLKKNNVLQSQHCN